MIYFATIILMMAFIMLVRWLALKQHEKDVLRERKEQDERIVLQQLEQEQLQKTLVAQEQALKYNDTLKNMNVMNEQRLQYYPTKEQLENLLFKIGATGYDQTPYKHLMKTYNALHIYPEPTDREDK